MGRVSEAQSIPGWRHIYSGKVRDLYASDDPADTRILVVASDRVSAFDSVLSPGIPHKGELLTSLSMWWFDQLDDVPNHIAEGEIPDAVAGRSMLAMALQMLPIECVVRGYLTGSGWAEYVERGTVCGIPLPAGLKNGDRLPEPLFTPAYKAPMGEHDENITFERAVELVGAERAAQLRDTSLAIYRRAAEIAESKGLILADTKFEFGVDADGVLRLADEALTSDSSRYWDAEAWRTGSTPDERMASFDKQIVRDWMAANWDRQGEPPALPEDVIERTADRYRALIERLRG
ncbi:phosphoribosylaminoimidazolesuccinocarboxamide synthase [Microbacterium esteraromaticum]|uniref:Phosphoribosylaminoimidazole-succinocarboxamide synthase n=1 Tax=Microbacterium esteraromaticum TaxID=57043 RepID=A0A939DU19_9MICO|nr:phosphoribosylaminoimidazolesuccinocarboxamide synthase [Microbacterium esteraromaticum]MBN8205004.1 phosphoribosylaminoimidazolesuccinocarboxamide synthase [Microbacterium esteraromaticum]MBN8415158.1 phosphoribosylaminoimidazolesuccinocarboxamide synthase [Microbacterium esteraromaticum]MBN8424564.1 phosphoribosylaminoimidazolesuccinocarboxamide synthase [Microbacterium esteraromaticum]